MSEELILPGIALVILGYGYCSRLLDRYAISGPMVFTAIGVLLSPLCCGNLSLHPSAQSIQLIAQVALILILFSDAASVSLSRFKGQWQLPVRLLFFAMSLSIVLSYLTARYLFPNQPELYLLLLAFILAPTDAALGKIVVTDPHIPHRIRTTLTIESGLNDGIVFPLLLITLALITGAHETSYDSPVLYIARQIFLGGLIGGLVGFLGARLGDFAIDRDWMSTAYRNLIPFALAIFAYYLAEAFGGNGYIAAFFGGLTLGNASEVLRRSTENFSESEGELLVMLSFLIFGMVFIPAVIDFWDGKTLIFALLSLTILRMIPVVISFGTLKIDLLDRLFIGWFGPRGIASILYILIAVGQLENLRGHETIFATASLTVVLSIFLHGLSARPLARLYSKKLSPDSPK